MGDIWGVRPLLQDVTRLDRSKISYVAPLRNAFGVAVPLAVGAATGQLLAGLVVSIGALNVAFSDRPGPYRRRVGTMLLAGLYAALSVFAAAVSGTVAVVAVALTALWSFGGGLLVALGPAATQIGLTGVVLILVFGAQPAPPARAAIEAVLILVGAALQIVLAAAAWPVRPFNPQRAALVTVFRELVPYTREPSDPATAPPATGQITDARTALSGVGGDYSSAGEALRALLDEAERIRLEVLALDDARQRLVTRGDSAAVLQRIDEVLDAAGDVLAALAAALDAGDVPAETATSFARIDGAAQALRAQSQQEVNPTRQMGRAALLATIEALAGQLRAAVEIVAQDSAAGEELAARVDAMRPARLRLREPAAILRANLTLRSAAFRHAVRLACCVAAGDAIVRALALPRGYWLPMTVAIVLKPDFAATFTRGLGRVVGTAAGLLVATGLVFAVFGDVPGRVVLVGLLVFAIRALGPANFALSASAVTALVVLLTSFAGARPETTIVERGIYTLAGGALALAVYALWPTWERTQTPTILADLLDAYRRYFAAVMSGYLDPQRYDRATVDEARLDARLARSNAEASLDRLRGEPARSEEELDRAVGILANSHRFVHSAMALEADLYHEADPQAPPELGVFVADVETTLCALAQALRGPEYRLGDLPDLRADQHALAAAPTTVPAARDESPPPGGYWPTVLAAEADRVADSVNTMTGLVRRGRDAPQPARWRVVGLG